MEQVIKRATKARTIIPAITPKTISNTFPILSSTELTGRLLASLLSLLGGILSVMVFLKKRINQMSILNAWTFGIQLYLIPA